MLQQFHLIVNLPKINKNNWIYIVDLETDSPTQNSSYRLLFRLQPDSWRARSKPWAVPTDLNLDLISYRGCADTHETMGERETLVLLNGGEKKGGGRQRRVDYRRPRPSDPLSGATLSTSSPSKENKSKKPIRFWGNGMLRLDKNRQLHTLQANLLITCYT